jgi:hypothetical protein
MAKRRVCKKVRVKGSRGRKGYTAVVCHRGKKRVKTPKNLRKKRK